MKLKFPNKENLVVQICNHCGHNVSLGSGRFVNRVLDLNDVSTRIGNGLLFPNGDFVCEECDNNSMTGND